MLSWVPKVNTYSVSLPQPLASGSGRLRVVLIHSSSAGRSAGATVRSSCIIACRAERNSILEQKQRRGKFAMRTRKQRAVSTPDPTRRNPPPRAARSLSPAPCWCSHVRLGTKPYFELHLS